MVVYNGAPELVIVGLSTVELSAVTAEGGVFSREYHGNPTMPTARPHPETLIPLDSMPWPRTGSRSTTSRREDLHPDRGPAEIEAHTPHCQILVIGSQLKRLG
ncbi:MAG: hypothetical protein M3443_14180 [Actinomycetota bacterium]|nr:hypothetical protein [Actinomycetota bacterium]